MQTFYNAKSMKEGIFSKRRVGGVVNKDTMFWVGESGRLNLKCFVEEFKREGYVLNGEIKYVDNFVKIHSFLIILFGI